MVVSLDGVTGYGLSQEQRHDVSELLGPIVVRGGLVSAPLAVLSQQVLYVFHWLIPRSSWSP
ncbi:hypothetical protein AB0M39_12815 [Streptomyces sp. NPDC051907]|uniref:hypothetical protein n=1 Tax=Streptomyces sp. NPDC051907 TaxID=3155284 RepID=UPI003416C161